jgi:hypothetical protein
MPFALKAEYFWDVDAQTLDLRRHERLIISRLLNYGTLDDWRWLIRAYGKDHLANLLRSSSRLGIRESARRLAAVVLQA